MPLPPAARYACFVSGETQTVEPPNSALRKNSSMAKPKYSYNPEPRLSANQLSELVNATPTRRKSIITGAKFPKGAIVAQYRDANEQLLAFLQNPSRHNPNFLTKIEALYEKSSDTALTAWVRNDAGRSAEALEAVQNLYNKTGLSKLDLRPLPLKKPKVILEGVQVSSSASCSVHGKFKKEDAVGCLSLLLNKSETSTAVRIERCRAAAVLSVLYAEQHLTNFGQAKPKFSVSYDVFRGVLVTAPNTYKKRLDNMKFACEEVVIRWPSIDPPSDYDGPAV